MTCVDPYRRLLELLAAGASSEQLAHAARESGADATELALRVRETLTEHQRREAELTALFDTASDLARLRDPDAVLRSIVRRARTLLGVDVSYLSLNDEAAGKTYIRVTDGSVSALFQQIVLGMGEGLGGLVAQTARPYATADYFADARFRHTSPIDTGVLEEGLTAILGVPLAIGGKVLGVLYASDRAPREFSTAEVALLSSLANHAAIALDSAHLLDETRRSAAELNAVNATMRRADEAHDRLMDLVLRGGDLPEVAAEVAGVLRGEIAVHDASGDLLAGSLLSFDAPAVASSRGSGRAESTSDTWVCAVRAGQELLGSLTLAGRPELAGADRRLFERAAVVTALLLMLRRSVAQAEDEVRGELLTDLLTAPARNPASLTARARRLGVDLSAPHVVLVAHAPGISRRGLASACARYGDLVGVHAEQVVALAPDGVGAAKVARELQSVVDCPVTVGAAGPAKGPAALAHAYAEAVRCVSTLLAVGREGDGAAMAELGFLGVLLGRHADLPAYVTATLGPVLDYDSRRGTDLIGTLRAYFAAGGNLARAKDELHVHVNTVVQRLDRVSALLGDDWREPERALEIQLALRVERLSGQ
ncbi:GAF domain-containing protein [Amycolatopsis sp. NPDC051372]|uniref:helix-turn-helix domain-containing protein n=1 Tax=Amycolatopsis sp. NPDC051372 TaxID=3155669 RepID=UPI00344157C3